MRTKYAGLLGIVPLIGTLACSNESRPRVLALCENPAPLTGEPEPGVSGYIVSFHDGADAEAETTRVEAQCGFEARSVFQVPSPGFSADLSPAALDCVRCEPVVRSVAPNRPIFPAAGSD